MESHQEACERAGTDQCQVMAANAAAEGDDRSTASLTLRATPAWMRMFRTRAEADARDLGGQIEAAATQGDDLSTSIVDTEAAQRTRAAERQRLTELMQRRTRDLGETVQIEQQITQVQGQMDQADSELAAMRNRIVMQTVTVSYESAAMAAPKGASAPLQAAARSFMGNVYGVLAVLLTFTSVLLPLGLMAAPVVWWLRRRKPKPVAAANPS
jgi:chromosome segregation ATPase